ncbi:hypothetical protein Hanom_Chr01g00052431 [Helianthus anomalus]
MVKIVDDRNGMNGVCENGDDGCSVFNNLYIERTTLSRVVFMVWQPSESSPLLNHRARSWLCA